MEEAKASSTVQDGILSIHNKARVDAVEENTVRLLVQEEGRAARNLIAFSVPCDMGQPDSGKVSRKPPSSPRTIQDTKKEDGTQRNTKRTPDTSTPGSRVRSASTGRDKKSELQARYWAFLFGNLQRAVDEIYQTCEMDESVSECKEVILVLENFTRDFHSLIEWFRLKWDYEKTPPPQRPTSLAWEVRKSSPGKIHYPTTSALNGSSPAKRTLLFNDNLEKTRPTADKVGDNLRNGKCSPVSPLTIPSVIEDQEIPSPQSPHTNKPDTPPLVSHGVLTRSSTQSLHHENGLDVKVTEDNSLHRSGAVDTVSKEKELPESTLSDNVEGSSEEHSTKKLLKEINSGSEKCSDSKLVKDVLVSGARCSSAEVLLKGDDICDSSITSSGLPAGMVSQACQTDLEFEEVPCDQTSFPTMVDKGVGTATVTGKITSITRPSLVHSTSTIGRPTFSNLSGPASVRAGINSSSSSLSSPKSSAAVSSKTTTANASARTVASALKMAPSSSSVAPVTSSSAVTNCSSRSTPTTTPGTVLSTAAPKASLASIVTRPSTASIVKRNISRVVTNPSVGRDTPSSQPRSGMSLRSQNAPSSSTAAPKLIRSRTVAEVGRPVNSRRLGGTRHQNGPVNGSGCLPQTRDTHSLESGTEHCQDKDQARNTQNTLDGNKKNESDDSGWETVKNRSRWRLSYNYNPKLRFNQPSCAVSLPALIIVDDIDIDILSANSASRRNSERLSAPGSANPKELSEKPSNVKKVQSSKAGRTSKAPPKTNTEKVANGSAKRLEVKKSSKELKEEINKSVVKNKAQSKDMKSSHLQNGLQSVKSQSLHSFTDREIKCELACKDKIINGYLSSLASGKKPAVLDLDSQLSGDESSVGPRTSPTTTPTTMTPATTPATPTTPTNSASDSMAFLRDSDVTTDRLISDDEELIAERTLLKEEERKSQQLYEEEAKLKQQIHDLETGDLEVETDGETQLGAEEDEEEELLDVDGEGDGSRDSDIDCMSLEDRYENMLEGLSWAERMDTLEQLEALVARHPGRALQLHQKLSSPSRTRASTLPETLRRFQARQDKAQQKRERLLQLKSQRLRELLNKVGEVKAAQAQLTEDRRVRLEAKLKRAEENRNLHLRSIKRKAHDEEEKLKEIAFINELEAQNKRHDFLALCQEQEERLQGIADERARRQEEKAAKEAAVEERRRALEAERQLKLQEMQARRRRREERIGREQQEKEKERQEAAREKARDREERLLALHAAQLATQEELQKKIQQKQEDSARRHEENIEHIRQRALDSAAPALAPYTSKKLCTLCGVLIGSEVYLLSHLRGKKHQEELRKVVGGRLQSASTSAKDELHHIIDAPPDVVDEKQVRDRERQRALRKRVKKIRVRMAARGQEYESSREPPPKKDSPNGARLQKCLRDVEKLRAGQGVGQWSNNAVTLLERSLAEMNRILDRKVENDQTAFCRLGGFSTLCGILSLGLDVPPGMTPYIPAKCFVTACTTLSLSCRDHQNNTKYLLLSNRIAVILDLLMCRLKEVVPDETEGWIPDMLPSDSVAAALMRLLALVLKHAEPADGEADREDVAARARDVVSYTVSLGAVDRLAAVCVAVRDPLPDSEVQAAAFLLAALDLLTMLTARCGGVGRTDPSGLGATLRSTELMGSMSMLYGMLLQQGGAPRAPEATPPELPPLASRIAGATIALLLRVAELDLAMFQSVLGAEGISLQLRHISAHLLWVCAAGASQEGLRDLLHLVIRVLGYFAVRNRDNQLVLQSGHQPTVLQQLCALPFAYFSVPTLSAALFPTLLVCCVGNPENRAILEHELSYQLLEDFRVSPGAQGDRLVALLQEPRKSGKNKDPSRASSVASNREGPDGKKSKTAEDEAPAQPCVQEAQMCEEEPDEHKQDGPVESPKGPPQKRQKKADKKAEEVAPIASEDSSPKAKASRKGTKSAKASREES